MTVKFTLNFLAAYFIGDAASYSIAAEGTKYLTVALLAVLSFDNCCYLRWLLNVSIEKEHFPLWLPGNLRHILLLRESISPSDFDLMNYWFLSEDGSRTGVIKLYATHWSNLACASMYSSVLLSTGDQPWSTVLLRYISFLVFDTTYCTRECLTLSLPSPFYFLLTQCLTKLLRYWDIPPSLVKMIFHFDFNFAFSYYLWGQATFFCLLAI